MNCACGCGRDLPAKMGRGRPQLYADARCRKLAEYRRRAAARAAHPSLERQREPVACPCGCGVVVVSEGARGPRRVYATAACRPRAARVRRSA